MFRADSVFTRTTGGAQRRPCNRFRRTILTPIRLSREFPCWSRPKATEIGVRNGAVPQLESTISLWVLRSNYRTGCRMATPEGYGCFKQSSNRYGLEWANYYTPREHLSLDFDLADSRAQFTGIDRDDAAPDSAGGKRVPEAVKVVISSGIALNYKGLTSSLRLRYFGPRDLTSDGIYRSNATALLNGDVRYQIKKKWRVSAEFLNMLNRNDTDIDYAYESRVIPGITSGGTPIGPSVFTRVAHPVEPFQVRFAVCGRARV